MVEKHVIGEHVLYLADCREVLPSLVGVDVVVTDPPYQLDAVGGGMAKRREYLHDIAAAGLEKGFDFSVLDGFGRFVVFCAKSQLRGIIDYIEGRGSRWVLLTWLKTNPTPLVNNNYLPDTEYIFHSFDKDGLFGEARDKARYIVCPVEKADYDHPTVKPVRVMMKLLKTASAPRQTVLDPFMGTGTTGVACARMGRRFIGIEIERKYFDIAAQRMEQSASQPDLFINQPKEIEPC